MPHTKNALILVMAFALPGAAAALGLGDIHVDSALNQPLAAEVDIVGATAEDLAGITASVANRETFLRFGADRPAFLSTAAFRIAMDSKGHPVLAIRSTDAFTEPLINLFIDLRWHGGELIREYTLLLDPAGFQSDTRVAEAVPTGSGPGAYMAPAAPEPVSEISQSGSHPTSNPEQTSPAQSKAAAGEPVPPETIKVAARATLRGIASRVSSGGDAGPEKIMIAIFRANPGAFEGNINRLRLGAVLAIPSFREVSNISAADANREIRLQMETWHRSTQFADAAKHVALAVATPAPVPGNSTEASDDAALDRRVQILEKELNELQGALEREQDTLARIREKVALADKTPAVIVVPSAAKSGHAVGASIAAILVIASGAFGALNAWRRRRTLISRVTGIPEVSAPEVSAPERSVPDKLASAEGLDADTAKLQCDQYKLPDFNGAVHHVPMPSILHEKREFKERRTSVVDVLNVAVQLEPHRRDLRMKLLETYYAAAVTSRQGFLEAAQGLAGERGNMTDDEWGEIAGMGRQIAADDDLFATDPAQPDHRALATCA